MSMVKDKKEFRNDYSRYGFSNDERPIRQLEKGLSESVVRNISLMKEEPEWMLDFRLSSLKIFQNLDVPSWGADLSGIDFDSLIYFSSSSEKTAHSWEDVPKDIKETFDRLGVPEAEQRFLAGVGAQYDSETIYHHTRKDLEEQGVIFTDMDSAVKKYPSLVRKYFGKVVSKADNKFAALNSAAWSGGSFVYVPKGVKVNIPIQAYFRINARNIGQFERTLIIVDEGASVHYIEGCTAPNYSTDALHAAVVEVIAMKGAYIRYTTVQNWSDNVYNLVTKRAFAYENANVEWVDGNLGSRATMKYPAVYLMGRNAKANILSIAMAGKGQNQDAGAKVVHLAPNTSSIITNKSISMDGGKTTYRGLVKVGNKAKGSTVSVNCDALILDSESSSDTLPVMNVHNKDVSVAHEAYVGRISDDDLFYLMSRGISEEQALSLIVSGFLEPFTKELPFEYAIELNKLIQLEMEGSVG